MPASLSTDRCLLIACLVTENAPEMTAWDAITVASVASTTIGIRPQLGTRR